MPPSDAELTTVANDEVVIHRSDGAEHFTGLPADSDLSIGGFELRTLPERGELITTIVMVTDVHFGEESRADAPPELRPDAADGPYPEFMNAAAIDEINTLDASLVVVKGDLTSHGSRAEYARFLDVYGGAFGDRLAYIRGNHESYNHLVVDGEPMAERRVDGVTVALLDTSRDGRINGSLSDDQIEWLDELGSRADQPVMVVGHHQIWDPANDIRTDDVFGLVPDDSERLFEVMGRRPRLVGYFAGHTHRNNRVTVADAAGKMFVETASVKDFPGTWVEYRIFEGAILQIHRRVSSPVALRWSERARHMFDGVYGDYAFGGLDDRCFEIPVP